MGSLSLRPGDSLTVPRTALSVGFIRFVSSTNATQATGFRLFPRWDSPPTEHASLSLVAYGPNTEQRAESRFGTAVRARGCHSLLWVEQWFTWTTSDQKK